jgi:carboxymethylenebutenolidase
MSLNENEKEKEEDVTNTNRRAVLSAGASGVAALALGAKLGVAQPDDATPKAGAATRKLTEREVTYKSGADEIRAFWAEPVPRPKAAIIVIHEIWGLNAHIRDVARRFARQGYLTLAPDLYTRQGTPHLDLNDRAGLMKFVASLSDPQIVADLQAAIEYLNAQGMAKVGSIGFCMGGLYSYLLACQSEELSAAVDFYGRIVYAETSANKPVSPLELAPQLKSPLLCCFGETDASIPQGDVASLRQALAGSTPRDKMPFWKINVYPGAGHAFFNDTRPSYNAAAAADAGTETLRFFQQHLKP